MPFSSLSDPSDLARAYAVLDAVWEQVKGSIPAAEHQRQRTRIAYLVLECTALALDEEELRKNVLIRYRNPG
jgi:hypothetical protein